MEATAAGASGSVSWVVPHRALRNLDSFTMFRLNAMLSFGLASSANTLLKDDGETGFFIKSLFDTAVRFEYSEGDGAGIFSYPPSPI